MRKKYTDETYLRGVSRYKIIKKELKEENAYLILKKIINIDKPFIKRETLIDNGYYIMEYTPLNKLYNIRVFIDKDLNTIMYYFDISLGNGIENGKPYYDDLFLDIIYPNNSKDLIIIDDEDELEEALNNGQITKEEYDLANKTCNELKTELKEHKNNFVNIDKKELIKKLEI